MRRNKAYLLWMMVVFALPALIGAARPAALAVGEPCDPAQACFDVFLGPVTLTGDFYVDGVLVVGGVNSARLTGTPDAPHTIEVRNIQEPGAAGLGDLFIYPDQSAVQQTKTGWIWRLFFYPLRTYLKGTLNYTCTPRGYKATDSLACRPTIDGATQADVAPGATTPFFLASGDHAVHTDLVGDSAGNWASTARDDAVSVVGGRTTRLNAKFSLKGLLKINLLPKGVVGDIYVNGALVAAQSAAAELYVIPGVANAIEAQNVNDPAANGNYAFNNVAVSAIAYEGGIRTVYPRAVKVWLTGQLKVYCWLNRKAANDDAQCAVNVDGAPIGTVPHNTRLSFTVPIGAHTVDITVAGASASRWTGAITFAPTIYGGGSYSYNARFSLAPTAPPASNPPPTGGGGGGTSGSFELGGQVASFSRPDLMQYAGMTWVKRQLRWSPGASGDGGFIADAHAKGFKILLSVLGEPSSIAGGANYDDYARFVGELARLGADGIEVWNEMNLDREWPVGEIDPNRYTDLLRRSYNAIKANNAGTLVISGAPAPTGAEGAFGTAHVWNDDHYIGGLAAAGAANYMDCIGVHYNEGIIGPTRDSGDPRDPYFTRYYSGMVSTYYNAFGGRKKLCFTELGYLSPEGYGPLPGTFGWAGNTTAAQQAQWLGEAASLSKNNGLVRLMIVFNVDFTVYGDDPQAGYAIIRPGGVCPACDALRGVTGGR